MTSNKQIEANRKNSQKSTGPSSMEGKAIVAKNAMRHGILSTQVLVDDDEKELCINFYEMMRGQLEPRGDFQGFLVDRIISTAWRLRRIVHIETLILCHAKISPYNNSYGEAFEGKGGCSMAVLSRYERSLENAFFRAMKELKILQEKDDLDDFNLSF